MGTMGFLGFFAAVVTVIAAVPIQMHGELLGRTNEGDYLTPELAEVLARTYAALGDDRWQIQRAPQPHSNGFGMGNQLKSRVGKLPESLGGVVYEGSAKRNIDEIDRTGFDNFLKRNFDEIDHSGWDTFVKRRISAYLEGK